MNIFKSFRFSLGKKRRRSRPKISAPAPAKILNRLQIQPKNLGSDRLRLRNTGNEELGSFYFKILCQHFFLLQVIHRDIKPENLLLDVKGRANSFGYLLLTELFFLSFYILTCEL